MRVWITRTRPGAEATAARLKALGIDGLVDPVLEVRAIAGEIDTAGFDALAFTSLNGVAAFVAGSEARDLPAFAVGEATAEALRAAGFAKVEAAGGDARALARLLIERRPGRILAPGPTEPAGDLAGMAAEGGVEVRRLAIYETAPRAPEAALAAEDLVAVTVHSPKAARILAETAAARLARLTVVALSDACAAPLAKTAMKALNVAPFPDDGSLARLVAETLADARA